MNNMFKNMFEKYLTPEDAEDKREEFHAPSGFRDTTTPYEHLRRSLKRAFPYYPDVFDYTAGPEHNSEEK